jgi:hypothetical protein
LLFPVINFMRAFPEKHLAGFPVALATPKQPDNRLAPLDCGQ